MGNEQKRPNDAASEDSHHDEACGQTGERDNLPTAVATQWHSPLPHGGNLADLSRWRARFDDPLLLRLIEAGQQASATLAQAAMGYALRVFPRLICPASRRPTKQAST